MRRLCLADVAGRNRDMCARDSGPVMKTAIYDAFIAVFAILYHDEMSECTKHVITLEFVPFYLLLYVNSIVIFSVQKLS